MEEDELLLFIFQETEADGGRGRTGKPEERILNHEEAIEEDDGI